jgi:hypothetical protein
MNRFNFLFAILLALPRGECVSAEIVFDNTSSSRDGVFAGTALPEGNQVTLSGTNRIVTEIDLLVSRQGYPGTADFQLWLYANDAPQGKPGTTIWNSGLIDNVALAGPPQLISFSIPNIVVPDTFTWALQDSDSRGAVLMAVMRPLTTSATVGTFNNRWFGGPGQWAKVTNTTYQEVGRIVTVPEPSTIALLGIGTLSLLAWAWRRSRNAV